jgi:iron complex transport system substrate-binding protein
MAVWLALLMAAVIETSFFWAGPAAAGSVLTSPRGGETWKAGSIQNITWNSQSYHAGDNYVELDFSPDNGSTWTQIAQNVPVVPAQYLWTVPDRPTARARIRIIVTNLITNEDGTTSQVIAGSDQSANFIIYQGSAPTPVSPTPAAPQAPSSPAAPSPPAAPTPGIKVEINGQPLVSDVPPYLEDDRVMVPFRAVFEALGATVGWDASQRAATGTRDSITVRLVVNSRTAEVNGKEVALDTVARIVAGRVFVPLRFVGEALGASVNWDRAGSTASIALPGGPTMGQTAPAGQASGPAAGQVTVRDSRGRVVMVPVSPKRIVVCNSYAADAICALRAGDSIIGAPSDLTSIPMLNQMISNAQNIGTMSNPKSAQIISLKPDIMFGAITQPQALTATLQANGIPVVLLDCSRIDTLSSDLQTLGSILGQEQRAADLAAFIDKYRQLVSTRLQGLPSQQKPRLYWEAAADYSLAGPDTPDGRLLALLGADNIAGSILVPASTVTPAWVVAQNPDVIIKAADYNAVTSGYLATSDAMQQQHDVIINRPGWNHISAVASDRVYVLSRTVVAGPQYVIGLLYAVKWLHPALFQDIDPAAVQKDMLSRFYGLEFNGAWAYPMPESSGVNP